MNVIINPDALIITRRDIRRLITPADFLKAVELGYKAAAAGKASSPMPMHLHQLNGTFHAKGAGISLDREYVAVKVNGNFPENPTKRSLPTIQGAVLLFDGSNGMLLAILDSIEVSMQRTAAASALAAKLLARTDASNLLICGCGEQGRAHVKMLHEVLSVSRTQLWDRDPARSEQLANELGADAVRELGPAAEAADVIVTCTTATEPFLEPGMISPGTFIAAVGADNPTKSEISPALMASATVVTDVTEQCAEMGDLRHAIAHGAMTKEDVHGELAQLLAGKREGRRSPEEIIIYDSTGTGLQDVAASAAIFQRCAGIGTVQTLALSAA